MGVLALNCWRGRSGSNLKYPWSASSILYVSTPHPRSHTHMLQAMDPVREFHGRLAVDQRLNDVLSPEAALSFVFFDGQASQAQGGASAVAPLTLKPPLAPSPEPRVALQLRDKAQVMEGQEGWQAWLLLPSPLLSPSPSLSDSRTHARTHALTHSLTLSLSLAKALVRDRFGHPEAVVFKPPGWQVDYSPSGKTEEAESDGKARSHLSDFLRALEPSRAQITCPPQHGFIHRLDVPSSGLILAARNPFVPLFVFCVRCKTNLHLGQTGPGAPFMT